MLVNERNIIPPKIYQIDRENIILPEVIIEDIKGEPSRILKPIFDQIWNAAGFEKSRNYDDEGNWKYIDQL